VQYLTPSPPYHPRGNPIALAGLIGNLTPPPCNVDPVTHKPYEHFILSNANVAPSPILSIGLASNRSSHHTTPIMSNCCHLRIFFSPLTSDATCGSHDVTGLHSVILLLSSDAKDDIHEITGISNPIFAVYVLQILDGAHNVTKQTLSCKSVLVYI
jgi:hypothetical protein